MTDVAGQAVEAAKVAKDALPAITQNPWATIVLVVVVIALAGMGMLLYAMRLQNRNNEKQLEIFGKTAAAHDVTSQAVAGLLVPLNEVRSAVTEIRTAVLALKDRSDRE